MVTFLFCFVSTGPERNRVYTRVVRISNFGTRYQKIPLQGTQVVGAMSMKGRNNKNILLFQPNSVPVWTL